MSTSVANMGGFLAAALLQPLVGWVMDRGWQGEMVSGARFYNVRHLAARRIGRHRLRHHGRRSQLVDSRNALPQHLVRKLCRSETDFPVSVMFFVICDNGRVK
jgi:hypothetical protein